MTTTNEQPTPRALVIGSSGRTGAGVAAALEEASERVTAVRASRNPETVALWQKQGKQVLDHFTPFKNQFLMPDAVTSA